MQTCILSNDKLQETDEDVAEQRKRAGSKSAEARWGVESNDLSFDKSLETDADLAKKANVGVATIARARRDQALDPAVLVI